MRDFINILNHPMEAFKKNLSSLSWILVIITILINIAFEPILCYFLKPNFTLNIVQIFRLAGYSILTYLIMCTLFWFVGKIFKSKANLIEYINSWGLTFVPTAICSIVVIIIEVFFYVFWNSIGWGIVLNIVFVGILIWKIIYYYIYLKVKCGLSGRRLVAVGLIMIPIIMALAALDGYLGIKTPIL